MKNQKQYYDEFFKKYGAKVHDDPIRFDKISSLCFGSVGDLGCGTGCLSDFYPGIYFGYDISDVAVELAKTTRRESAEFESGDLTSPAFQIHSHFDTIVLTEFLEHIKDDTEIFSKIKTILNPGGRIIISVPNGKKIPDESHVREFTMPELRKRFSPLGKVKFHNYPGFSERILMTVDTGQENDNLISLVIPAKNEALGLENAILSCINFVDNIVVSVDDASTDETLAIAKMYADQVKIYQWENSFCKARNFAQYGITTKWILALDGHEYVAEYPDLEKNLAKDVDGLEIRVVLENDFKFHFPRIVKSSILWEADVHNYPKIKSRDFYNEFIIRHDREHSQAKDAKELRDKQRSEMVLTIMTKKLKENKNDSRACFYLAQQYFVEQNFRKAIKFYTRYLKHSKHKGERWLVCLYIAKARIILNHKLRALWALNNADKEIPGRWEIEKARGSVWGMIGNHKKAVHHFIQSFSEQVGNYSYCPEKRDDAQTWDFVGHCLFNLNQNSEAKIAWQRSLELEKLKPESEKDPNRTEILERMLKG